MYFVQGVIGTLQKVQHLCDRAPIIHRVEPAARYLDKPDNQMDIVIRGNPDREFLVDRQHHLRGR